MAFNPPTVATQASSNGFVAGVAALEPLIIKIAAIAAIVVLTLKFDGISVNSVIFALTVLIGGQTIQAGLTGFAQAKYGNGAQTNGAAQQAALPGQPISSLPPAPAEPASGA